MPLWLVWIYRVRYVMGESPLRLRVPALVM